MRRGEKRSHLRLHSYGLRSLRGFICGSHPVKTVGTARIYWARTLTAAPAEPDLAPSNRETLKAHDRALGVTLVHELHKAAVLVRGHLDVVDVAKGREKRAQGVLGDERREPADRRWFCTGPLR